MNSRSSRRTTWLNSTNCDSPSVPASLLAVFFIGGSLSPKPREWSRGDVDRHFNFNSLLDYAATTELSW
jgi:hypothetical protein